MSKFEVVILPIDKVENHPNADRLSLNYIRGYVAVSNKLDDGSHRYKPGQLVAYVPVGAVVPDSVLKARGYWDDKKDKGFLGGPEGNVVKPIVLRGVLSCGLIFPTEMIDADAEWDFNEYPYIRSQHGHIFLVREGDDVTAMLGITKDMRPSLYQGERHYPITYEVENLKSHPTLLNEHQVMITELLHGVLCVVGYDRALEQQFFVTDGYKHRIDATSDNPYTQAAKPIWENIKRYLIEMPAVEKFFIFGELIGPGIQDITYGLERIEFRALDIQMGLMGGGRDSIPFGFLGPKKYQLFKWLNLSHAPLLWGGKFNPTVVEEMTNGQSAIGGGLRKGVVITSEDENLVDGKRPILKNISNKFLLRTKGTDFK